MRGARALPRSAAGGHHHFGVPVGIGEDGSWIQLGFVLHQTVQDERRFSQPAGNGLLMQAHRVLAGVGVERDATTVQEMAEVSGQDVDGHVETHAIRRTGIAEPVEEAHRLMDGVVD